VERESAEISLVIGETSFWGQGIGQEAMTLLLNFGFTELRLVHIWLIVRVDNKRAIDLFSGLGFTRNEILNNSVDVEGVPCDKWRMALDKNAWIPKA
jgi:RimJ/RimL family protein N-acetyltransferase